MNILFWAYLLDIVLLFAMPIVLGVVLVRKFVLEGRLWWTGAIFFVLSQIGHLPFDNYLINPFLNRLTFSGSLPSFTVLIIGALVLGLSAALWEELFRYGMFRFWAKQARTWMEGILLGAGHGGAAAIILGILVLYNFANMVMVRNLDLSTVVTPDQVPALQAQIAAFWSVPWYHALWEAVEQLFLIPVQICCAVLVLQTFLTKKWYWVAAAIGFHMLVEASGIVARNLSSEYVMNAIYGVFAVAAVAIIFAVRKTQPNNGMPGEPKGLAYGSYRMASEPKSVEEMIAAVKKDKDN